MAGEEAVMVAAGATILTWVGVALVDAVLAVGASEACHALTGVVVNAIDAASIVHAGCWRAIFIVNFTICSRKSKATCTSVGVDIVVAGGIVLAGT